MIHVISPIEFSNLFFPAKAKDFLDDRASISLNPRGSLWRNAETSPEN